MNTDFSGGETLLQAALLGGQVAQVEKAATGRTIPRTTRILEGRRQFYFQGLGSWR